MAAASLEQEAANFARGENDGTALTHTGDFGFEMGLGLKWRIATTRC